jgi:hypothetical protein
LIAKLIKLGGDGRLQIDNNAGVRPHTTRMAPLITVLVAIATSLLGLAIETAKGDIFKTAPGG